MVLVKDFYVFLGHSDLHMENTGIIEKRSYRTKSNPVCKVIVSHGRCEHFFENNKFCRVNGGGPGFREPTIIYIYIYIYIYM